MAFSAPLTIPKGGQLPLPPADGYQPPFSVGVGTPTPESLLPPNAAARLRELRQYAADMHSLTPDFAIRQAASTAKLEAEARLKRLTDHAQLGGFGMGDGTPQVIATRKAVSEATAEVERLNDLYASRSTQRQSAARVLNDVEGWLRSGRPRGTALEDYLTPAVKLARGENGLLDAIANRRRRISELKAELDGVQGAPYPSGHCKQRAREAVEALAQRGAVDVSGMVRFGDDLKFTRAPVRVEVHNVPAAVGFTEVIDAAALVSWAFKEALLAKLDAAIDAASDDSNAMFPEDRQTRGAEIGESILEAERAECSLIWRALGQNLPVDFRADCAPLAILECVLVTARG